MLVLRVSLHCTITITTKSLEHRLTPVFCMHISYRLSDFKEFAEVIDAVKDKGVVVAVASPDDVENANKERPDFFEIKKAL